MNHMYLITGTARKLEFKCLAGCYEVYFRHQFTNPGCTYLGVS